MAEKKVKTPPPQYKFFLSGVNTLLGQAVIEIVRNDHINDVNPHIINGTKAFKEGGPIPGGVKKLINNSDIKLLTKTLLESDIIIYDVNTAPLDEIEFALKVLKVSEYTTEKLFILVSSVMVWSNTPQKEKKEGDEDAEEEPEEADNLENGEEGGEQNEENAEPKKVYVAYKEKDFKKRKALPKYEPIKSIETLCLSAGTSRKNLSTYVLCSGILYGHGEQAFASYFKEAWLQNTPDLPYPGSGKNIIPTIHVKDLAMFVSLVINKRPPIKYIYAIDQTKKSSLKNIIAAISKGLGTGKTRLIPLMEKIDDPNIDILLLNIKLKPSEVVSLADQDGEEEQPVDEEEESKDIVPKFKFTWWCKDGMEANLNKIIDEYNTFRGLRPIKVFVSGPPAAGKTYFGAKLASHFNLPHILIADVVKMAKEIQGDFGEKVRTTLEEIVEKMYEDAVAAQEAEKKKKKKNFVEVEIDKTKLIPRLPDDLLSEAVKIRISKNDCANRGYVLDGFPRNYENARGVFLVKPAEEEDKDDGAKKKDILDKKQAPEFVILLNAKDEYIKTRIKELPEEKVLGTHYNEEGMHRRMGLFKKNNFSENGAPILETFFKEHGINLLKLDIDTLSGEDAMKTIKIFIEKTGKFENYQNAEAQQEEQRKIQIEQENQKKMIEKQEFQRKFDEKENEERKLQEEKAKLRMEAIKEEEKKLLDIRSQPLRQYLADNVVPILTEGIIQICKEKPEDPVDFLAEFLFKKSLTVKNADPMAAQKK